MSSDALREVFADAAQYFPTPLQQFQFFDKYSRFNYDLKRRETWTETVDRAVEYLSELAPEMATWLRTEGRHMILTLQAMPSMRLLAMAGPAARRQNLCIYNCAYLPVDDIQAFVEMLIISMSGCGVGFSVEHQNVNKLPIVALQRVEHEAPVHVVEDSTEGWAAALRLGLETWFGGGDVVFDFSQVRAAGAPLRTKGGRASGPRPLRRLLAFVRKTILSRQGESLRTIDAHDIACAVGDAAVSGGMRRTAMISLYSQGDELLRHAKQGKFPEIRWNANNSEVWRKDPSDLDILQQMTAMFAAQNGEPGIFSGAAAARTMPSRRREIWQTDLGVSVDVGVGVNPCQPDFATVLTPAGIRTFADIDVGSTIWSGRRWTRVVGKVYTGVKPVFEFRTTAGCFIGTENHRVVSNQQKVEASKARSIDSCQGLVATNEAVDRQAMMDGWVIGDGTVHKASANLVLLDIGTKDLDIFGELRDFIRCARPGIGPYAHEITTSIVASEIARTYERRVPARFISGSALQVRSFLRGLYSANGSICGNRVTLKAASLAVIDAVQNMLSSLGIRSYVTTNKPTSVKFANGTYLCKQSYDLNISTDRALFRSLIGFCQAYKNEKLSTLMSNLGESPRPAKSTWSIQSRQHLGDFPVYDITVEADEHTYWTGGLLVSNCGEVLLRPQGLCNLSIAVARADDTITTLERKVRAAAIFGTIQATATHFPGLRPEWRQNAEAERLLGVDITGQMDCPLLTGSHAAHVFDTLKRITIAQNVETAAAIGTSASLAATVVKPGGNSSSLINCGSGLHGRHARFYVRNVRVSAHSPVYKVLREAGAPLSPENGQTIDDATTWVCSFPCRAPDGAVVKGELSALRQLDHWLLNKLHWTDHNPSCTITYRPDEMVDIVSWLRRHRDVVGGLSFLPHSDAAYEQMPYVEIDEAEYERRLATFPTIDWSRIVDFEDHDETTASQELACTGDRCEL